MRRELLCVGDATDIATWSGTPYHFLQAGRTAGFLTGGWRLQPERLKAQRLAWNLREFLLTGRRGGFQYSEAFLSRLMAQQDVAQGPGELLSHFPLLPGGGPLARRTSFYIDATLQQLFQAYGFAKVVSPRIAEDALRRERENYLAARRIVCMSGWAARSVVQDYGADPNMVHVIPGGANLDESKLGSLTAPPRQTAPWPIRLAFVGKDIRRKNLTYLLSVADILSDRGYPVEVLAAGFPPERAVKHRLLKTVGFIDKRRDFDRFVSFVRSAHFGCLFSHAEAFGLSNREFLRLGVPVLTWDAGGMADTVPDGLGHVFRAGAAAEEVADTIAAYAEDSDAYRQLLDRVAGRAHEAGWTYALRQFAEVWNGSAARSFANLAAGSARGNLAEAVA